MKKEEYEEELEGIKKLFSGDVTFFCIETKHEETIIFPKGKIQNDCIVIIQKDGAILENINPVVGVQIPLPLYMFSKI